jgi:hypothetical protein
MTNEELPKVLANYDQFDAAVREQWKRMPPEMKEAIGVIRDQLKLRKPEGTFAALLLGWATCTMHKRDAEERHATD